MITFFNNPYDKVSVNTLQYLFVNGVYPMVVTRTGPEDDKGFHISFLPTVIMSSDDFTKEYARVEDYTKITPTAVEWLFSQWASNVMANKPLDTTGVPDGVIIKS